MRVTIFNRNNNISSSRTISSKEELKAIHRTFQSPWRVEVLEELPDGQPTNKGKLPRGWSVEVCSHSGAMYRNREKVRVVIETLGFRYELKPETINPHGFLGNDGWVPSKGFNWESLRDVPNGSKLFVHKTWMYEDDSQYLKGESFEVYDVVRP